MNCSSAMNMLVNDKKLFVTVEANIPTVNKIYSVCGKPFSYLASVYSGNIPLTFAYRKYRRRMYELF